ncbi:hypothetical protein ABT154_12190 [Streptomyces sp. NPDC001728]|uniref:hypothetical protein n=1 Tax=Streptomyces sp. NPDC001728 TaxID=3154396 RepID=UPI00332C9E91
MSGQRTESVDVPVVFERPLSLFAYIIGHGQILLRGEPNPDAGLSTTVEVLFKNVGALSLRDHYSRLTVRLASPGEADRIRDADPRPWRDRRAFVLETDSGADGHVVAGAMYWGERSGPVGYSSFLIPEYDLPRFRHDRPGPSRSGPVHDPFPRR